MEFAYARHWRQASDVDCTFAAGTPFGGVAMVPRHIALALLDALAGSLAEGQAHGPAHAQARRLAVTLYARLATGAGCAALIARIRQRPGSIFLLVSHKSLEQPAPIQALRDAGARFVPSIHDLIPIDFPEYQRPEEKAFHEVRMRLTLRHAAALVGNSRCTASAIERFARKEKLHWAL